ncbi:hypothetical protein BZA70DRAFT_283237 [Myxozyma melibiosi]|uniref:Uncharacterized protein n=1 Tax=Myxozyma melibiosi TaxID=54550 RepID=A0ABR1F074_9ASCO
MSLPYFLLPIAGPVVFAAASLFTLYACNQLVNPDIGSQPLIRELPQSGLTSFCIRPQFRYNDRVLNVYTRPGARVFRFMQQPSLPSDTLSSNIEPKGLVYTLLRGQETRPFATIRIQGLHSEIVFHNISPALPEPSVVSLTHAVDGDETYRMFILPDGRTYQWTGKERFLEQVIAKSSQSEPEIRNRIGSARRIGSRIWELKFDETQLSAELVLATALVSIFDQWNTSLGVFGWLWKSDEKPSH